jgi:hypothetical protein
MEFGRKKATTTIAHKIKPQENTKQQADQDN